MSQLNLSFPEDLKIDLSCKQEKSIEDQFKEIAEELINNYCIVKKKDDEPEVVYRFMELEFYYCSRDHFDVITYPRKAEAGDWFFHSSGVDICFKSNVEFAEDSAKPIGSPKDYVFGGILIRALSKQVGEEEPTYITGPLNCCYELFDKFSAFASSEDFPPKDFPIIEKRKNENVVKVISCGRYFHFSTSLGNKLKNIYRDNWNEPIDDMDIDKFKEYVDMFRIELSQPYCFFDHNAFEAYEANRKGKRYNAVPSEGKDRLSPKE